MWCNYFQVFLRDLRRQKLSAGISIVGLALGLCVFLMIGLYVRDEYSWDSHWEKSERIVRLVNEITLAGRNVSISNTAIMAGPLLKDFLPAEIEAAARVLPLGNRVFVEGEAFSTRVFAADRELVDIFDFDVVAGELEAVFMASNRIALSEENAARLFGDELALGKTLTLESPEGKDTDFEVVAIYRLPPVKGALRWQFDNFSLLDESAVPQAQLGNWLGEARHYFLLREHVAPADLTARLDDFVQQRVRVPFPIPEGSKPSDIFRYRLQPIRDIHFNPNTDEEGGFQPTVNGFGVIAIFVLAISLANFVILNLARSVERQREVGIRKVAGALRRTLLVQFVCESLLLSGIALGLALVLAESMLPVFAVLMGTTLDLDLLRSSTWFTLAALVLGVGVLGGLYPALALSWQQPHRILRPGGQSGTLGIHALRKLLVGFQFLIAIVLISATIAVYQQLSYMRQRDPGFDARNVVTLGLNEVVAPSQVAALRNAISAIPGVQQSALASHAANAEGSILTRKLRNEGGEDIGINFYQADYDFFSIYNMRLLAGRLYDKELDDASQSAMATLENPRFAALGNSGGRLVINESTSKALGFSRPADAVGAIIEETVTRIGASASEKQTQMVEIIGVIADNQFHSLRMPPRNEVYDLQTLASWYLTLKVDPEVMPTIAEDLQRIWRDVIGSGQAQVGFVENNVQLVFDREQREGRLLLGFSTLAVIVACLGLYGLVAFEARRRTKEIGIRTVLGGEFGNILALFLAQFGRPVVWANLLAWPLALWAMLRWLERFPYQIERWWLPLACVVAGLLVSLIVSLTVGATVFSAAGTRPVQALRYE